MQNFLNKNMERNKKSNQRHERKKCTVNRLLALLFDLIVLLGILSVSIEIAHYSNTAIAMLFLAAVVFMYGKKTDLDEREHSEKRYNEHRCLYNAHMFTKYKGKYISSVELLDVNSIRITLNNGLTLEIGVMHLSKLENVCDYEALEKYIAEYVDNNSSYSRNIISIMLENDIQNYLDKIS